MTALDINKVQSALGTLMSTFNFFRNGHLNVRSMLPSVTMGIVGSIIGIFTVQSINGAILAKLMPLLLLAISLYFLFSIFYFLFSIFYFRARLPSQIKRR